MASRDLDPRPPEPGGSLPPAATPAEVPDPRRLASVVDLLVADLRPDQIILFGSGARGGMTERSDLDLLVIREPDGGGPDFRRHWCFCPTTGAELDVLVMSRGYVEAGRLCAADVRQEALEDGRTLYLRPGVPELPTGPPRALGDIMVPTSRYTPDESLALLDQAERKWDLAEYAPHSADKCEMAQASIERALKALVAAQGLRVTHHHRLSLLWDAAEQTGEHIPVTRHDALLTDLSYYAGERSDKNPPMDDSDATWRKTAPWGRSLLQHVRRRVPELVERTRAHNRAAGSPDNRGSKLFVVYAKEEPSTPSAPPATFHNRAPRHQTDWPLPAWKVEAQVPGEHADRIIAPGRRRTASRPSGPRVGA